MTDHFLALIISLAIKLEKFTNCFCSVKKSNYSLDMEFNICTLSMSCYDFQRIRNILQYIGFKGISFNQVQYTS